jgi:hypothetical protein
MAYKDIIGEAVADDDEARAAQNTELRAQIGLGMDMEIFLDSTVGKLLTARANADIREFQRAFEGCDLFDNAGIKEARKLQFEIAVRRAWKDWIQIAISEGESAQAVAQERGEL